VADAPAGELAVNLLWCVPGVVGGSEEYVVRQLVGLHEAAPELAATVRLYVLPGMLEAHPELGGRFSTVTAPVDGHHRSRRVLAEATWLADRVRHSRLVHHAGGTVPPRSPRPVVLTIHDLQYVDHPQYFSPLKRTYLRRAVPRSIRRATVVAVPSEFVRRTVVAAGAEPAGIVVVPHGVEPTLGARSTPAGVLRDRYHLGLGPTVVYPAITHPHKNHRFLLDLMAGPWKRRDVRLVLLGGAGRADAEVRATIAELGLAERVVRPGRVPAADRDGLLAMADALVFPSEYEGFGAPVLEAMALGTPVVASDRAALPEVVGDAGLVLPLEFDAWAGALDTVTRRRASLIGAGRERAAVFTASASGAALADAYRAAMVHP
jgi:alpha-1,3-rhamnosyl/mannosyltransferase